MNYYHLEIRRQDIKIKIFTFLGNLDDLTAPGIFPAVCFSPVSSPVSCLGSGRTKATPDLESFPPKAQYLFSRITKLEGSFGSHSHLWVGDGGGGGGEGTPQGHRGH